MYYIDSAINENDGEISCTRSMKHLWVSLVHCSAAFNLGANSSIERVQKLINHCKLTLAILELLLKLYPLAILECLLNLGVSKLSSSLVVAYLNDTLQIRW